MDIANLHSQLARIANEADAAEVLQVALPDLGADVAIFVSYVVGDPTLDSYRFVLSAPKAFCDAYLNRYWFLNDPCILYSNSNTQPIRLDMVPVQTAAQREILDEAAKVGFRSGLVVPVHGAPSSSRAGVLFLGAEAVDRFRSHQSIETVRPAARLIAMELYDFISGMIRRQLLDSAHLSSDELTLLRLQRDGYQSKEMAEVLSTSPAAIDARFTRLNRKLGVANRRQAAEMAAQYGLVA